MASIELVEKLRERTGVTYEEAKTALDACGDDLLDALIYLEKQGKASPPVSGGSYSSKDSSAAQSQEVPVPPKEPKGESFSDLLRRFSRWCAHIVRKGCTNYFEVWRGERKILSVPVIVLIVLLFCAFWITLPLIIVGLFCNCRYRFRGQDIESVGANEVMDSVADAADNLKSEVKAVHEHHQNKE